MDHNAAYANLAGGKSLTAAGRHVIIYNTLEWKEVDAYVSVWDIVLHCTVRGIDNRMDPWDLANLAQVRDHETLRKEVMWTMSIAGCILTFWGLAIGAVLYELVTLWQGTKNDPDKWAWRIGALIVVALYVWRIFTK